MLIGAFALLSAAALLGMLLAALYLRATDERLPPWWVGALHGTIGAGGVLLLLLALRGPPRGAAVAQGAGGFGVVAAAMLGTGLLAGLAIPALWRWRRGLPGGVMAIHAIVAIGGYVILAAYLFS